MRHFLRDDDLTQAEQTEILDLADAMKKDRYGFDALAGPQTVAVLFDKASTRTRVSFALGITELGGYPLIMDSQGTQIGRGESVADTARFLSRVTSAIVWRTFAQSGLEEMAANSSVPVVNALSDDFHPCQILADWQTVREHHGALAGVKVAYVGDGANNMAQSYLIGGATAGMHVTIGSPVDYRPKPEIIARANEIATTTGGSISFSDSAHDAATGADVVITDTWVSMGDEDQKERRIKIFNEYSLTKEVLAKANKDAIVMHCLPAYRGLEIAADVIDGPQSVVWQEAENRLHAQKALLSWLVKGSS